MDDDVPDEVKRVRNNELLAVQNEISLSRKQALIGQEVEVLVEGLSKAARKAQGETAGQVRARGKTTPAISTTTDVREAAACDVAAGAPPTDVAAGPRTGRHSERSEESSRHPDTAAVAQLVGRTPGDLMTIFDAPTDMIGAIVKVRVADASPHTLFGEVTGVVSPTLTEKAAEAGSSLRILSE